MDCFDGDYPGDYPAAHSMDTSWFAIDEAGRVAVFNSGEDGAVPIDAISLGGASESDRDADTIRQLLAPDDEDALWGDSGPFFHYQNGDYGNPGHYVRRDYVPAEPANIASLPADLRAKMLRLPVDFTSAASLHLADFMDDGDVITYGETSLRGDPLAPAQPVVVPNRSKLGWWAVILVVLAAVLLALSAG